MKAFTCPQCGGLIRRVSPRQPIAECGYCGAQVELDEVPAKPESFNVEAAEFRPPPAAHPVLPRSPMQPIFIVISGIGTFIFLLFLLSFIPLKTDSAAAPKIEPTHDSNEADRLTTLEESKIPTVTYCELVKNARDYDRKIVRVRAIYFNAFERTYLYDEHCTVNQPPTAPEKVPAETWAEWDKSLVTRGDSEEAVVNRQLNGFGRKDVLLVGRFSSRREESNTNFPNLFGDLNCCRFQFQILRLEKLFTAPLPAVEEGPNSVRIGQVEWLKESEGKVSVSVAPFAQLFFLHRSDPNFEEYLGLLNEALKTKRPVWCSIRSSSGRIVKVSNRP